MDVDVFLDIAAFRGERAKDRNVVVEPICKFGKAKILRLF
jgi:hypothetical protein